MSYFYGIVFIRRALKRLAVLCGSIDSSFLPIAFAGVWDESVQDVHLEEKWREAPWLSEDPDAMHFTMTALVRGSFGVMDGNDLLCRYLPSKWLLRGRDDCRESGSGPMIETSVMWPGSRAIRIREITAGARFFPAHEVG